MKGLVINKSILISIDINGKGVCSKWCKDGVNISILKNSF